MIQRVQELLQVTTENAAEQIRYAHTQESLLYCDLSIFIYRLLRSAKYKLERDLADKLSALGIDDTCQQLSPSTQGIGFTQQDVLKVQTK